MPQLAAPQAELTLTPGILKGFKEINQAHGEIADRLQELFRSLHSRAPGGFQAARLAEILEVEHGAEHIPHILHSLQREGVQSAFFRETQTHFRELRDGGGTEMQLRREWQGKQPSEIFEGTPGEG